MSRKWHPDVAKTEADKEKHHEKMVEINRGTQYPFLLYLALLIFFVLAYEVLNDPRKRERYDMFGDDEDQPQQPQRHHPYVSENVIIHLVLTLLK